MPPTDPAAIVPSSPPPDGGLQRKVQGLREALDKADSPEHAQRVVAVAKGLRATAERLRGHEKQADELQTLVLWAKWKLGRLIERLFGESGGPSAGGRPPKNGPRVPGRFATALRKAGISEDEAQRVRVIARLSKERVQQLIDADVRTESALYAAARGDAKRERTPRPGAPFTDALAGLMDDFDAMTDEPGDGISGAASTLRHAIGLAYLDALDAEWVRSHRAALAPLLHAADLAQSLLHFATAKRRPS
jgi:hypothetical protein